MGKIKSLDLGLGKNVPAAGQSVDVDSWSVELAAVIKSGPEDLAAGEEKVRSLISRLRKESPGGGGGTKQPGGKEEFAVVDMISQLLPEPTGCILPSPARPRCTERKLTPGQLDIGLRTKDFLSKHILNSHLL